MKLYNCCHYPNINFAKMERRDFIKKSSLAVIGTAFLPQFLKAGNALFSNESFKKLIVIQLSGGNDGLNTIVPYRNEIYYQSRPRLALPKQEIIPVTDDLGINGSMKNFADLYEKGYVSILNSVGYPNPNRSHFRSMDIWQSASGSNEYLRSGWLGRYLDANCTQSHETLEIESTLSLALKGEQKNGLAVKNSDTFYRALQDSYFQDLLHDENLDSENSNLNYLYKTLAETNESAKYLFEKHTIKKNTTEFPKTKIGRDLDVVSQFIQSGLNTKVYYISHNGFDTHVNQKHVHNQLLKEFSEAVSAFVKSLEKSGQLNDILILTFSEFGRRTEQNASGGTDHGKANNLFLIGNNLKKPGVFNENPDLTDLDEGDLKYTIDFRSVYQEILSKHLETDSEKILKNKFPVLTIL
jgi:uncharacterized protein (DUF1501 family)